MLFPAYRIFTLLKSQLYENLMILTVLFPRIQEIQAFLETQTGFQVVELSPERLRVEFLKSSELSANIDPAAEFKLQMTLNFDPELRDAIRLASVKVRPYLRNYV